MLLGDPWREKTVSCFPSLAPLPGPRRLSSRVSDARLSPSSRDVVTVSPRLLPQADTGAGSPGDRARGPRERLLRQGFRKVALEAT